MRLSFGQIVNGVSGAVSCVDDAVPSVRLLHFPKQKFQNPVSHKSTLNCHIMEMTRGLSGLSLVPARQKRVPEIYAVEGCADR